MKMKDIGKLLKTITEQANDINAEDPFAPIPHDGVTATSTAEEKALIELTYELNHATLKLDALTAKLKVINQTYYNTLRKRGVSSPRYALSRRATVPNGQVRIADEAYTLAVYPPKAQAWLTKAAPIITELTFRVEKLKRAVKTAQKNVDVQKIATKAASVGVTNQSGSTIPVANIPKKLQMSPGSKGIDNPYWLSGEYAGHPSGFNFSTPMKTIYVSLEATLNRHGLTLDPLYVGRYPIAYMAGPAKGPINFVTQTSNLKVTWRKYDVGGGSGQNWLFLNGTKMNTSNFMSLTEPQRDTLLKSSGVI